MKFAVTLAFVCGALLLGSCSDQSLLTDEDYYKYKGPAPFSPDPMQHIPVQSDRPPGY
jgi:hypothetical protein